MPRIKYLDKRFSAGSQNLIQVANAIIAEYEAQGFELTLRQLYYQFVARDIIENKQKEYKRLGAIVNDARLAGLIDWNSITDRTRNLQGTTHWDSPAEIVHSCVSNYRIDKWENQPYRVEVWIEKDALVGVIERTCNDLDLDYFSCRGYTSQSEMWVASQRLKRYAKNGQTPVIIHLGDHDPSGKDMTRDIDDRLDLFMGGMKVHRIALNMDQIKKYNPPPNPAKITDSRAREYIKKFGNESWELDALDPKVIDKLIRKEVLKLRDDDLWQEMLEREQDETKTLSKIARELEE